MEPALPRVSSYTRIGPEARSSFPDSVFASQPGQYFCCGALVRIRSATVQIKNFLPVFLLGIRLLRLRFSGSLEQVKNVTVKCPEDVQRRFAAWCKLNGRTIQEVLIEFMRQKGDALARFEDKRSAR
jgi:hypothetical protein